jgi:hypothetical protein
MLAAVVGLAAFMLATFAVFVVYGVFAAALRRHVTRLALADR